MLSNYASFVRVQEEHLKCSLYAFLIDFEGFLGYILYKACSKHWRIYFEHPIGNLSRFIEVKTFVRVWSSMGFVILNYLKLCISEKHSFSQWHLFSLI